MAAGSLPKLPKGRPVDVVVHQGPARRKRYQVLGSTLSAAKREEASGFDACCVIPGAAIWLATSGPSSVEEVRTR